MSTDTAVKEMPKTEAAPEQVYRIFPAIAGKYRLFNSVSSLGLYKSWLRKMVSLCPLDATTDLLDIAGGTGDVSFMAACKKHPRHIQLTDLVPEMLEVAHRRWEHGEACGVPLDFAVVEAHSIPYADNSYDVVTLAYGIRNMRERERALTEILRVLKPGGTLVCLEFSKPTNAFFRVFHSLYLNYMIPFWGMLITGDREGFIYLKESIKAFPDQKSYAVMLESAGFTQVKWVNCSAGITAIHTGVKKGQ
ncbi:MAG: ubiquinone/menaquinone biosynthesis methyltransferase [Eggerthellaceae bacterium]|nr:ubiquinone/menaquinone biosynthesis methyltransferase [Eggerthellaceae bacterium]